MAVQAQSSVQNPVALAPCVGQANATPSASTALPPSAARIIMIADPHPMSLTKPNKRTKYNLRSSIRPEIGMNPWIPADASIELVLGMNSGKYVLKHTGNEGNAARLEGNRDYHSHYKNHNKQASTAYLSAR